MNLSGLILKWMGWKVSVTAPNFTKCIICVAPHTSNWDFFLCKLTYASVGRKAGFLMKSTWFFPPLSWLLKSIGGVPVKRGRGAGALTDVIIEKFGRSKQLHLAITPEGTRSRVDRWRTGFLHIAYGADVPIVLGVLDFKTHTISVDTVFEPTGDVVADINAIKEFYRLRGAEGRRVENFSTKLQDS